MTTVVDPRINVAVKDLLPGDLLAGRVVESVVPNELTPSSAVTFKDGGRVELATGWVYSIVRNVECIDCHQQVLFTSIGYGEKCPEGVGASGVQYGHRIWRDLVDLVESFS